LWFVVKGLDNVLIFHYRLLSTHRITPEACNKLEAFGIGGAI